jgi:hypothetical protein
MNEIVRVLSVFWVQTRTKRWKLDGSKRAGFPLFTTVLARFDSTALHSV